MGSIIENFLFFINISDHLTQACLRISSFQSYLQQLKEHMVHNIGIIEDDVILVELFRLKVVAAIHLSPVSLLLEHGIISIEDICQKFFVAFDSATV